MCREERGAEERGGEGSGAWGCGRSSPAGTAGRCHHLRLFCNGQSCSVAYRAKQESQHTRTSEHSPPHTTHQPPPTTVVLTLNTHYYHGNLAQCIL